MKRFLFALALLAGTPIVAPVRTLEASAVLPYGEYRVSDGVVVRVYWHSWPDIWTLVSVEPA